MTRPMSQTVLLGTMAAMGGLLALFWTHPGREMVVLAGSVGLIGLSLLLERLWPHNRDWAQVPGAELAGDLGSFALVFGGVDSALKWLTPIVVVALWPQDDPLGWPLWVQVAVAALWIEFAGWVSHWAHHRFAPLWALHAMHHAAERLYTFNNFRFHPLNHVLNHLAMILPVLAVGISGEAVLIYTALSLPVMVLQHSNAALDFGGLNRVFNTNDLHRWHHSAEPEEGTQNLGRALVLWDQVFGTYLRPDAPGGPARVGLFQSSRAYPGAARFWAQLTWPCARECCRVG